MKPILFLDTNVCIDVAKGKISPEEWRVAKRHIQRTYIHRISPHTLTELLIGIQRGDNEHFQQNREPLRVLSSFGNATFLPFPWTFTAKALFGRTVKKPDFEPEDLKKWLRIALGANTKSELKTGVHFSETSAATRYALDVSITQQGLQKEQEQHASRLEKARLERRAPFSREKWGYHIGNLIVQPTNDEEARRITDAFDAAYAFDSALVRLAAGDQYDFAEHASDFLDMNQLFYLCDPRVNMLTRERKLVNRISASTQQNRVHRFEDLLAAAQATTPRP